MSHQIRSVVLVACCIIAGVLVPSASRASLILFEYSGKISFVGLHGATDNYGFSFGQSVTGSFLFDDSVADDDPSPIRAFSPNSIRAMTFDYVSANPSDVSYSYFLIDANPL